MYGGWQAIPHLNSLVKALQVKTGTDKLVCVGITNEGPDKVISVFMDVEIFARSLTLFTVATDQTFPRRNGR